MGILVKKYATDKFDNYNTPSELLTPKEMSEADRLATKINGGDSFRLMERAGQAVTDVILNNYRQCRKIALLCGPGNNGGDGYMIAHLLKTHGFEPQCFSLKEPRADSDAMKAFILWGKISSPIDDFVATNFDLVVDALYGAGLDRTLDAALQKEIRKISESNVPVIAVDLPSGVSGRTGAIDGEAVQATKTVTFFRLKPGHVCYPGRAHCGEMILADIGVPDDVLQTIKPTCAFNAPPLWSKSWPVLDYDTHKYRRGHTVVFSGPLTSTGAARLAAHAAARSGAGLVTVISPKDALLVHEMHLTSIMLREMGSNEEILTFLEQRKVRSVVLGPAFGEFERAYSIVKAILTEAKIFTLVLDADALTAVAQKKEEAFELFKKSPVNVILTPHEGEFSRLFPNITGKARLARVEKAEEAAAKSGATIVYKGADTMIASPDGRVAINANGTPFLATAGAGDVLSGIVGGLSAQNLSPFETACASVWIHAQCGQRLGQGMIAEDIISVIPLVLGEIVL